MLGFLKRLFKKAPPPDPTACQRCGSPGARMYQFTITRRPEDALQRLCVRCLIERETGVQSAVGQVYKEAPPEFVLEHAAEEPEITRADLSLGAALQEEIDDMLRSTR